MLFWKIQKNVASHHTCLKISTSMTCSFVCGPLRLNLCMNILSAPITILSVPWSVEGNLTQITFACCRKPFITAFTLHINWKNSLHDWFDVRCNILSQPYFWSHVKSLVMLFRARFLSLARSKLRLCSANHRPGYWSNLPCDWPSTVWAYSKQETENGPRWWLGAIIW